VPEVERDDAVLHVATEGEGEPVTVFAHGLMNSCRELAALTPALPGTRLRFCFRGHGHSTAPDPDRYRWEDLAGDLIAVADAYGATRAVGTSMGAAALCRIMADTPDRFERLIFLLPAALDREGIRTGRYFEIADILERFPPTEAAATIMAMPERRAVYQRAPWMRDLDAALWAEVNPEGVARAIRGIVGRPPLRDASVLRAVRAPSLVVARGGDTIHPADVAEELVRLLPHAELLLFADELDMYARLPEAVQRSVALLAG
jgi:3-oxoadipate enol-lactonase